MRFSAISIGVTGQVRAPRQSKYKLAAPFEQLIDAQASRIRAIEPRLLDRPITLQKLQLSQDHGLKAAKQSLNAQK